MTIDELMKELEWDREEVYIPALKKTEIRFYKDGCWIEEPLVKEIIELSTKHK